MDAHKTLAGKNKTGAIIDLVWICSNSTRTPAEINNEVKRRPLFQFFLFNVLQARVLCYNL